MATSQGTLVVTKGVLTRKGPRLILGTNCEKLSLFKVVRKKWKEKKIYFQNSTAQVCTRLLKERVENISKTLTTQIERL